MEDIFEEIHELQRQSNHSKAIDRLLDSGANVIRKPYACDKNHAWYLVGHSYAENGEIEKALKAFRKSVNYWDEDPDAYWAIGECYSELERPRMAERYFSKALPYAALRDRPLIIYNLGNSLFDQGRFEAAIDAYRKVCRSRVPGLNTVRKLAKSNIKAAHWNICNKPQ
ncbi:MAG: tetratricopeptide repeat protein [Woeseiaceae bacterium]